MFKLIGTQTYNSSFLPQVDVHGNYFIRTDDGNLYQNGKLLKNGIEDMTLQGDRLVIVDEDDQTFLFNNDFKIESKRDLNIIHLRNDRLLGQEENVLFYEVSNKKQWESTEVEIISRIIESEEFFIIQPSSLRKNLNQVCRLDKKDGKLTLLYHDAGEKGSYWDQIEKKWMPGKLSGFIGVYNNILWLDFRAKCILGIDVYSGEIKYEFSQKPEEQQELVTWYPITPGSVIDKNGLLFGLDEKYYYEIDLKNSIPKLQVENLTEEMNKHKTSATNALTFNNGDYDEDYIYFKDITNRNLNALNRKTKKIDWQYTFPKSDKGRRIIGSVIKRNNNLYVNDNQGGFYIFEKE